MPSYFQTGLNKYDLFVFVGFLGFAFRKRFQSWEDLLVIGRCDMQEAKIIFSDRPYLKHMKFFDFVWFLGFCSSNRSVHKSTPKGTHEGTHNSIHSSTHKSIHKSIRKNTQKTFTTPVTKAFAKAFTKAFHTHPHPTTPRHTH